MQKKKKNDRVAALVAYAKRLEDVYEQFVVLAQTERFEAFMSFAAICLQVGSQIAFLVFALSVPVCCDSVVMQQYVVQRLLPTLGIAINFFLAFWIYKKRDYDSFPVEDVVPEPVVPYSMSTAAKTKEHMEQQRAERLSLWQQRKMAIEVVHDFIFTGTIVYFFAQFGPGASLVGCVLAIVRCSVLLCRLLHDALKGANRVAVTTPVVLFVTHNLCIIAVWIAAFISLITEAHLYRSSACYDPFEGGWFSDNALCGAQYCGAPNNISMTISSATLGGEVYSFCSVLPSSYKFALRPDGSKGVCCHWDRP